MTEDCGLISKAGRPVPLEGVSVTGDILGAGAWVTLRQRFKNNEDQPIEAIYKFPLPEGAAVCGFQVHLDGRVIQGQVEEREKAFKIYDEALGRGDGGYLLEQERPNIFTLMVGNLNPGMEVLVEIEYVTLLDWEGDKVRFFLPTPISPRYIPARMPEREGIPEAARIHPEYAREVPYGLSLDLNIHDAASIQAVESPSHLMKIEIGADPIKVTFYSETVRMDRDFILYCRRKEGTRSRAYAFQSGDERFMQLDLLLDNPRPAGEASAEDNRGGLDQNEIRLSPGASKGRFVPGDEVLVRAGGMVEEAKDLLFAGCGVFQNFDVFGVHAGHRISIQPAAECPFFMDYNDRPSNVVVDVNGRLLPRRWYRPPSHRPLRKENGPTGIFGAPGLFPDRTKERQPLFVPLDPIHQESPAPDHPPVDYTRRRHHRVPDRPMTGNGSS